MGEPTAANHSICFNFSMQAINFVAISVTALMATAETEMLPRLVQSYRVVDCRAWRRR